MDLIFAMFNTLLILGLWVLIITIPVVAITYMVRFLIKKIKKGGR